MTFSEPTGTDLGGTLSTMMRAGARVRAPWLLGALAVLGGCAPLSSEHAADLFKALGQDQACVCGAIGAWVGAGSIIPIPPAVPGGAGRGYTYIGRCNAPNTKLVVSLDGCSIERGPEVPAK